MLGPVLYQALVHSVSLKHISCVYMPAFVKGWETELQPLAKMSEIHLKCNINSVEVCIKC